MRQLKDRESSAEGQNKLGLFRVHKKAYKSDFFLVYSATSWAINSTSGKLCQGWQQAMFLITACREA